MFGALGAVVLVALVVFVGSLVCANKDLFDGVGRLEPDPQSSELWGEGNDGHIDDELYFSIPAETSISEDEKTLLRYVNDEVIVHANADAAQADVRRAIAEAEGKIVGYVEAGGSYQVRLGRACTLGEIDDIAAQLSSQACIKEANANLVLDLEPAAITEDPVWEDDAWKTWGLAAIHAPEAWSLAKADKSVTVGIWDQGFYPEHEDLTFKGVFFNKAAVAQGKTDHGTHVAGIVGANANDKGVVGVAHGAQLVAASCMKDLDTSFSFEASVGFLVQRQNAKVVSISLGDNWVQNAAAWGNEAAQTALAEASKSAENALLALYGKGYDFLICKSAGNLEGDRSNASVEDSTAFVVVDEADHEYECVPYTKKYEDVWEKYDLKTCLRTGGAASFDFLGAIENEEVANKILMVGAAQQDSDGSIRMADYSSGGRRVDLLAPGTSVYSTVAHRSVRFELGGIWEWELASIPGSFYGKMHGTSMATPMVSGVAALVYSANPDLDASSVKEIICSTAQSQYQDNAYNCSHGLLDAERAVQEALSRKQGAAKTESPETERDATQAVARDIALVLDSSGSMEGDPIEQTREAASTFVDRVAADDTRVGAVAYDSEAEAIAEFGARAVTLKKVVQSISAGGGTNMEEGMEQAERMLTKSAGNLGIIVLMSDGEPTDGLLGDDLIAYADQLKARGIRIYALGFNESAAGQALLTSIASEGRHYEVQSTADLEGFFTDIADDINGVRFMYVRAACPVDVSVSLDGETLSSQEGSQRTRTSFGTLSFEDEEGGQEGAQVKVLRLKEGSSYEVSIVGTGKGSMDYSIGFVGDAGDYDDFRSFNDIAITETTIVSTKAEVSDMTSLAVDEDGDGMVDKVYRARANEEAKPVDNAWVVRAVLAGCGLATLAGAALFARVKIGKRKMRSA